MPLCYWSVFNTNVIRYYIKHNCKLFISFCLIFIDVIKNCAFSDLQKHALMNKLECCYRDPLVVFKINYPPVT